MHTLHASLFHQLGPTVTVISRRFGEVELEFRRQIDKRFLDEPRHHARIGAAACDGGRTAGVLALFGQQGFAQRIIGACGIIHLGVEIEAKPRLNNSVDIKCAVLAAIMHQID